MRAGGCEEPAALTTWGLRPCTPGATWGDAKQAQLGCNPGGEGRPSPWPGNLGLSQVVGPD